MGQQHDQAVAGAHGYVAPGCPVYGALPVGLIRPKALQRLSLWRRDVCKELIKGWSWHNTDGLCSPGLCYQSK